MKRFLTLLGLHALVGVSIAQAQTPVRTTAASNVIQIEDSIHITRERWRDSIFRIDKSQVPTGILIEYSLLPFVASKYDGVNNDDDTLKTDGDIFQLHSTLKNSVINNKAVLPNTDSLYDLAKAQTTDNTIPLTFLYQTYNMISATAYSRGLLNTTPDGFAIVDVANRTASPFDQYELFAFQPFRTNFRQFGNITFTLPAALWQMSGITNVSVDFGDGSGFRTISKGGSAIVHYATTGVKQLTAQITTIGGTRIAKSTFTYSRPEYFSAPDYTWTVTATPVYTSVSQYLGTSSLAKSDMSTMAVPTSGARVFVENGCDKKFDKPIIIVEGFDPDGSLTMQSLMDKFGHFDFKDKLREYGYDFVYVEFTYNGDFIENNAKVLEEVIKKVNSTKVDVFKSTVIGYSMGGLVVRWCLKDMEDRGVEHNVANYISYDAPHQGANIPLGLQCLFLQLVSDVPILKYHPDITKLLNAQNSPAGRQMLVQKPDLDAINAGSSSIAIIDPLRTAFANRLLQKGYPQKTNNYAVALGRGNNISGTKNAGNGAQWNNFAGGTRLLKIDLTHPFMSLQTSTFANPADGTTGYINNYRYHGATGRVILKIIPVFYNIISKRDFRVTSQYCYDDSPGSFEMTQKEFARNLGRLRGHASQPVLDGHLGHNFVATASSLDLQNQNYGATNYFQSGNMFYNIDTQIQNPGTALGNTLATPSLSPFKAIMTATSNCVASGSNCQAEEYFDVNGTKLFAPDPGNWNHDHDMVYMRGQFAKFLTKKILSAEPIETCDKNGTFCGGNPVINGAAHFCDVATYTISGVNNLKYKWTVSSNLSIVEGEDSYSVSIRRLSDGYGTISVTLQNQCGTQRTLTRTVHTGLPDASVLKVYGPSTPCPTSYNTYTAWAGAACTTLIGQGVTSVEWSSSPVFDGIIHNTIPDNCPQIYDYAANLKFRDAGNGFVYSLRVRAINDCGTGPWSANTNVTLQSSSCGGGGTTFTFTTTPNPASNDIYVDIEEKNVENTSALSKSSAGKNEDSKIVITDLMGNIKLSQKAAGNLKSFRINVNMLPEGNYILNVTHKGVSQGKQIIISH